MHKVIYILIFFIPIFVFGQVKTIGTPSVQNYPKSVYNAGTQNWGIAQDANGFIYFANNDGLLQFDGLHWNLIEIAKNSPVRSVMVDDNNNIYVGLINDFGIIKFAESGLPVFFSLMHLLPVGIEDFDDIWRIQEISEGIAFQCYKYLFVLKNEKVEVVKPQKMFHFSFIVNDKLILHEPGIGLFEYKNGELEKLPWSEAIKNDEINIILAAPDSQLLIGTGGKGIYKVLHGNLEKWNTPASKLAEKYKLYCTSGIKSNYFAIGTILNGVIISDYNGNIIQQIGRPQGLLNNTVLSIFSDKSENIWLGLDNGISHIETNSPISFIADYDRLGAGYCCREFKGNLYLGTNQGLYVKSISDFLNNNNEFKLVENSAGQVWSLDEFDGQLICGHNIGTFKVDGNIAKKIGDVGGAWKFIHLKNRPEFLIGGYYTGLVLFKKGPGGWEFVRKLEGFDESSRYLGQSRDGSIWVGHGGKGIYRVTLSENLESVKEFKHFTAEDGLPSNENNILFEFRDKLYISTIRGIFKYDDTSNSFIVASEINSLFNLDSRLKTLYSDKQGNIWYIAENESGVMRLNEDLTYTKINLPFKKLEQMYINEFEFIYPLNDKNVFIGIDNGFAHYTSDFPKSYSQPFQAFISKIEMPYIDSTVYLNNLKSKLNFEFPFKKNTFRFHFSAPFFENPEQLKFSLFLENYSDKWSDWSLDSYKDFTNLHEGEYSFQIKAQNIYGVESGISVFDFIVLPPWHRSRLAWVIYLVLVAVLIFVIIRFVLHRIELSKRKEAKKHQKEMQKKEQQFQRQALVAEKEIIQLRNEKLRNEMIQRDKELANQTMNVIQKNRFLKRLNEELLRIQSSTTDAALKTKMIVIKKRILKEIDDKEQNRIFETYFDEVHDEFFKRMKDKYQDLSTKDLRLCAYIKMDISTKEIAALLNISYRGVEINRYRLRKKLDLSRDVNLAVFLANI